ncbi:MAG: zf-HC2 domain-containing protein [Gaiellales bacterium]
MASRFSRDPRAARDAAAGGARSGQPLCRECEEARVLFSDYLDRDLGRSVKRRVDAHLGKCRHCRTVLSNLQLVLERLRALAEILPAGFDDPDLVTERLVLAWQEQP